MGSSTAGWDDGKSALRRTRRSTIAAALAAAVLSIGIVAVASGASEGGDPVVDAAVVGSISTPNGGYRLVTDKGGVYAFGGASFAGSMAGLPLQAPVVGGAGTPDGNGYWLTAADGGVFAFGTARYLGSGRRSVVAPVAAIAATGTSVSLGYRLVTADGGVYNYGSARYAGRVVYRASRPISSGNTAGIPADYLALYQAAAPTCSGLPWEVLAGIGSIETNHGRSRLPGVHSGSNYAGAKGPMQFLQATFDGYAVDGDGDGIKNVYDPADAIFSAAHYLCANGAGNTSRLWHAIYQYNHADWYVDQVLRQAVAYGWNEPSGVRPTT